MNIELNLLVVFGLSFVTAMLTWIGNALYMSFRLGSWKTSIEAKIGALDEKIGIFIKYEQDNNNRIEKRQNGLDKRINQITDKRGD